MKQLKHPALTLFVFHLSHLFHSQTTLQKHHSQTTPLKHLAFIYHVRKYVQGPLPQLKLFGAPQAYVLSMWNAQVPQGNQVRR